MEPKSQPVQPRTDPTLGLLIREYVQQAVNEQVNALRKEIKLPALGIDEARTHHEQFKIENDKREKETLKTKGELEKMKKEVELLKSQLKVSNDQLEEMKREKAGNVRMDEIQKTFNLSCEELDLAFLVHVDSRNEGKTGKVCWKSSLYSITRTVANVATEMKKQSPQCTLRVAFAPYRDYRHYDQRSTKYDTEPCDFTSSFTGPDSFFVRALTRVGAAGPAIKVIFEKYVAGFSWDAANRILIHIADNEYPPHSSMRLMNVEKEVKEAVGGSLIIVYKSFQEDISAHDVLKYVKKVAVTEADMAFQQEEVDKTVPSWTNRPVNMSCSYCKHKYKWDPGMQNLISTIKDYKTIECEPLVEKVQVQIAEKPYSEVPTAFVWPYYAKVTLHQGEAFRRTIVHRFKTPERFKDMPELQKDWHKRDHYLARMEVLLVAAQMAEEFNSVSSTLDNFKKLEFTQVSTLTVGSGDSEMFYNMETLEGDGVLCSSDTSSADKSDFHNDILQAFTHWTHHQTQGLLMVRAYSEGVRLMVNRHGEDVLKLSDPVIHCTDVLRFTTRIMRTDTYCNLGSKGFELFYKIHKCKDLCKHLQLPNPAIPVVETGV